MAGRPLARADCNILGHIIKSVLRFLGYSAMPDKSTFDRQLNQLVAKESMVDGEVQQLKMRPYIDVILDMYPGGYEFIAFNDAAHLSSSLQDIQKMVRLGL